MKRLKSQILIQNPVDVEKALQDLQIYLGSKISYLDPNYSFGKIDRNKKSKKDGTPSYIPEVYWGGKENIELFPDDFVTAMTFMFVKKVDKNEKGMHFAEVDLIGYANLSKIAGYNAGGNVIADFYKYIKSAPVDAYFKGYKEKAKDVFVDFDFDNKTFADMQPFYVFSIQLIVNYLPTFNCA